MPGAIFFPFPSLHLRPGAGGLLRSFFESIAFATHGNIGQLIESSGYEIPIIKVGGGMSRNVLLLQIISDVTRCQIQRSLVADCTAVGCAALAMIGRGIYRDTSTATKAMCHWETIQPAANEEESNLAYEKWRTSYDLLDLTRRFEPRPITLSSIGGRQQRRTAPTEKGQCLIRHCPFPLLQGELLFELEDSRSHVVTDRRRVDGRERHREGTPAESTRRIRL